MSLRPFAPIAGALLLALVSCASPGTTPEASPPSPQAGRRAPGDQAAGAIPGPAPRAGATAAEIRVEDLRLRIGLLAHDSMRGRESGSPEKERAGDYLANEAERLGLTPGGGDGTYFQAVPLERRHRTMEVSSATVGSSGGLTDEDIVFVSGLGGLPSTSRGSVEGDLVFGGYLFDPEVEQGELRPDQLVGANVILRMDGAPGVGDPPTVPPRTELAMLFGPQSPAAAVLIVAEGELEDFWEYARDVSAKGEVALRGGEPPTDLPPFFLIAPEAVERLMGASLGEARRPRTDLGSLQIALDTRVEPYDGRNVVAIVPGSDPSRTHEYMTLGAHYDHMGVGTPVDGDSIYNGADDNASGTSAILEVAEYLAHLPEEERPTRSVLFIWHAAEEAGLLGSEHFTDHPTVRRDAMIAHINMDMVGRNDPDSLFLVGSRRLSTEYGQWIEEANADLPHPFVLDYEYDEPGHPEMIYCRSDHWNFARYGIPVVKIGSGLHDDYHQPSDTPEKIEYEKVARVAQFAAEITRRVADAPAPPLVDQAVPAFGAPCEG